MNGKLMILLVLGLSIALFGCTKQASEEPNLPQSGEISSTDDVPQTGEVVSDEPSEPGETLQNDSVSETEEEETVHEENNESMEVDEESIANLFQVETDKPLEDEGLDVETPASSE